jgi:hypothetical protein
LRGTTELNDKWYLSYYVDAGDSDITWQAALAANYRMKKADLVFGYRYLDFDLDGFGSIDELNIGAICRFKVQFMMAVCRRRDVLVVG